MSLSASERARYSRHLLLDEVGAEGQERLRSARVLIVGAGGLGSPCAMYLAAAGVGTLGIIDGDTVDLSNLQRQLLFATADVGLPKARVARTRLLALNPEIDVQAHEQDLTAANAPALLGHYEFVIDGSDRLGTRYLVNDASVLFRKPLVTAAIHRFEGQAMTYLPGQGPCYRCLFPDTAEDVVPNCATAGVLGVLPGVMGAIQATEAIKLITGAGENLAGRLLTYDALSMSFASFRFSRRADCAVCGERPSITTLRAAADAGPAVRQLGAPELQALLATPLTGGALPLLIDVREPDEYLRGHLTGALNVPMGLLPERLVSLPRERLVVFICAAGLRSLRAAELATAQGLASVASLRGGVQAWPGELRGGPGATPS